MTTPVLCLCAPRVGTLDDNGNCGNCCVEGRHVDSACRLAAQNDAPSSVFKSLLMTWRAHCVEYHGFEPMVQSHKGNGAPQGAFAFTLTSAPADGLTEADMVAAVRKIMNQKSCPLKKYAWYLEYGKPETKEHPHIHGMYETEKGGVIEKKHFQRAWKIWDPSTRLGLGFRGGYHRPVRHDEAYDDYIKDYGSNDVGERFNC